MLMYFTKINVESSNEAESIREKLTGYKANDYKQIDGQHYLRFTSETDLSGQLNKISDHRFNVESAPYEQTEEFKLANSLNPGALLDMAEKVALKK